MPAFSRFAFAGALAALAAEVSAIRRVDIQEVLVSDESQTHRVATLNMEEWNVYDSKGPKFTDIAQGALGDCYYLAGLASIAQRHPDIIKKAFRNTGKTSRNGRTVFELRFLLDGEEKIVAVDDMVPMRDRRYMKDAFMFASFNDGDNAWPALLEKGFAKLQGSYLAIRGGIEYEAFKAITQAPVDVFSTTDHSPQEVYDFIQESMKNNWPMTGGSVDNPYGTASGHAYVVMEASISQGTKIVRVNNPWAANQYTGALASQQTTKKGDYWMLMSEFQTAFDSIQRARIVSNAHVASVRVPIGAAGIKFTAKTDKPFTVQLEYPSHRMLSPGCRIERKNIGLRVAPESSPKTGRNAVSPWRHFLVSNIRADMDGGRGAYMVYAMAHFENMPAIDEYIVNIYGEEEITDLRISSTKTAGDVVDAMYGTCEEMSWARAGKRFKRSSQTFKGSVLWEGVGCNDIIYMRGDEGLWLAPSKSNPDSYYPSFQVSDLKCLSTGNGGNGGNTDPGRSAGHRRRAVPGTGGGSSGILHHFDRCQKLSWNGITFLPTGSTYNGAGTWQSTLQVSGHPILVRFVGSEWMITPPNDDRSYYAKGVDAIQCLGSSLVQEPEASLAQVENMILDTFPVEEVDPSFLETAEAVQHEVSTVIKGYQRKEDTSAVCSQRELKAALQRIKNLDNFDEMVGGREDSLFPPQMSSIGDKDADCGDSATGKTSQCDKLNHWDSITARFGSPDYTPKAFS